MEKNKTIGSRLKAIRTQQKQTQVALSAMTGIDRTIISKLENHNKTCTAPTASILAKYLGVNTDWLVMGWYPKYRK